MESDSRLPRLLSPARTNRAVRGGTISAAFKKAPPKRRHSSDLVSVNAAGSASGRTWYGDPVLVSGGRHPQALAGNDDEVNRQIQMFDTLPTAYLLDLTAGVATRLLDGVRHISHARDYGPPTADRDHLIVSDSQSVLKDFAWPVTTAVNQLLAMEYLIYNRSSRNLADLEAMQQQSSPRPAAILTPPNRGGASS